MTVFNKTLITTKDNLKALNAITAHNSSGIVEFNYRDVIVNSGKATNSVTKLNNAFNSYNGNLSKSTKAQSAYIKAVSAQNSTLGNYLSGLNGAKATMGGYVKSLVGAKVATIGLQVASTALNAAISMGLSLAISALVSTITNWINKEKEAREEAIETAKVAKEESDNLSELLSQYNQLSQELKNNSDVKQDLLSVQSDLLEALGIEASQIDTLIEKYGDLDTAINQVTLDSLRKAQADLMGAVDAYEEELLDVGGDGFWGGKNIINATGGVSVKAFETLEKAGIVDGGSYGSSGGAFVLVGDDTTVEGILQNYQKLKDAQNALNDAVNDGTFTMEEMTENPLYKAINTRLNELETVTDTYSASVDDLNKNIAQQQILSSISEMDSMPETKEEFEAFKQSMIDTAVASTKFIGAQDDIKDSIVNVLSTMPEFEKYFETISEVQNSTPNKTQIQWSLSEDQTKAIDDFKSKLQDLSGYLEKEVSGTLTDTDLSELLVDFPTLTSETDNLTYAIQNLISGNLITLLDFLGEGCPDALRQSLMGTAQEAINFGGNVQKLQEDLTALEIELKNVRNGKVYSSEEISKLIAVYGDLDDAVIELANGGYSIEEDKLVDLMNTKIEESNTAISTQIETTNVVLDEIEKRLKAYKLEKEALEKISDNSLQGLLNQGKEGTAIDLYGVDAVIEAQENEDTLAREIALNEKEKQQLEEKIEELRDIQKSNSDLKKSVQGSSSSATTFDWVETVISRIKRTITNLSNTVSTTYKSWSTRNNALAQEISAVNNEIKAQQKAYETYMAKANSVNLSDHYKNLVMDGGFDIDSIGDETLKENIELFKDYYEKALDCTDAIEGLNDSLADLAKTKFDSIQSKYDNSLSLIEHNMNMLEGMVSQAEESGYLASEVFYEAMSERQKKNISTMQEEYSTLSKALNEAVANGDIAMYSEDWYDMYSSILDIESALQDATTSLIEYNNAMRDLEWNAFDRIQDYTQNLVDESSWLIDLLSANDKLYSDTGSLTEDGLAVQGLHAMNYNVYMEQAKSYAEELAEIEKDIARDSNNLTLIDRRNELLDLQQEAISNAQSEKDALIELASNGYDNMLESIQGVIDKYKEALNVEKDLYSYQKNIESQTSNIASLRKQLEAYSNIGSEEAKAKIQQLQVNLLDAESKLEETEFEQYINEQQKLLDYFASDTEEWVNQRLDDVDKLLIESIDATNQNAATISNKLEEVADSVGYTMTSELSAIWNDSAIASENVVRAYGDILKDSQTQLNSTIGNGFTTVQNVISTLNTNVYNMINAYNNNAKSMISSLNKLASTNNSSSSASTSTTTSSSSSSSTSSGNKTPTSSNSSSSSSSAPTSSTTPTPVTYTVRDARTKSLLYSGTESQCKVWMSSHNYSESSRSNGVIYASYNGVTSTSSSNSNSSTKKYTVLTVNGNNVVASNLTYSQAYNMCKTTDKWKMVAYANGTTNAKKGIHLVGEAGDEIVLDNHGNATLVQGAQLYPFEGGETVLKASDTAEILQNQLIPLSVNDLWGNIQGNLVKTPDYSSLSNSIKTNKGNTVNNNFEKLEFILPNVTDADSLITELQHSKRFENIIQGMTTDVYIGKNSFSKYKY